MRDKPNLYLLKVKLGFLIKADIVQKVTTCREKDIMFDLGGWLRALLLIKKQQ